LWRDLPFDVMHHVPFLSLLFHHARSISLYSTFIVAQHFGCTSCTRHFLPALISGISSAACSIFVGIMHFLCTGVMSVQGERYPLICTIRFLTSFFFLCCFRLFVFSFTPLHIFAAFCTTLLGVCCELAFLIQIFTHILHMLFMPFCEIPCLSLKEILQQYKVRTAKPTDRMTFSQHINLALSFGGMLYEQHVLCRNNFPALVSASLVRESQSRNLQ
jgi:hypothetical protein